MMEQLELRSSSGAVAWIEPVKAADHFRAWLAEKSPHTVRAYLGALDAFYKFFGGNLEALFALGPKRAYTLLHEWRARMSIEIREGKIKPKSANLRLGAVRSLLSHAQGSGLIDWSIKVKGFESKAIKDTRGPSVDDIKSMLETARAHGLRLRALRDEALIWILSSGLRRSEIVELDVYRFDLEAGTVSLKGKGRLEREIHPLSPSAVKAVSEYLELRRRLSGAILRAPAFTGVDYFGNDTGERLTGGGLYWLIRELSRRAGVGPVRLHAFRHSIGTELAKKGDPYAVQAALRHKSISISMVYIHDQENRARDAVDAVAELIA